MSHTAEPQHPPLDGTDPLATAEFDRAVLNALTNKALEPQVYFGRGLELSDTDRVQLGLVATDAEAILEPNYKDPAWNAFQALVQEGADKGVLLSFASHAGTNVPTWCVDGGQEAAVKKIRTDTGKAAIEVPSRVFNLYHWTNTIKAVRKYAATPNETLYGRATKALGRDLQQLAHLIGKSDDMKQ